MKLCPSHLHNYIDLILFANLKVQSYLRKMRKILLIDSVNKFVLNNVYYASKEFFQTYCSFIKHL